MSGLAPLVVVLGPTASGKSVLGIELAKKLNGEILVCDSTQIYRHFDIGTGKVPPAEQQGIPHHLVDLIEPEEVFTAGEYRRRALAVLADLGKRGKLPIITAGTGLYVRGLLEGLADAPERSEAIRKRLHAIDESRGPKHLHRLLSRLDPESAARIAAPDTQKIIRAIEMRLLAGKPVGEIHRSGRIPLEGYRPLKIGLLPPRDALYARIHSKKSRNLSAPGFRPTPSHFNLSATPNGARIWPEHSRKKKPSGKSSKPPAVLPNASSPGFAGSRMCSGSPVLATLQKFPQLPSKY
jgi:tRNA dimethylallyltransferase